MEENNLNKRGLGYIWHIPKDNSEDMFKEYLEHNFFIAKWFLIDDEVAYKTDIRCYEDVQLMDIGEN